MLLHHFFVPTNKHPVYPSLSSSGSVHCFSMFSPMASTGNAQQKRSRRVTNPPPPRHQQQRRPYQPRNRQPMVPVAPALPEEVIEHIFAFLPIKNAVQSATLAKRYERSWSLSRHLVFDMNPMILKTEKLVRVIDGVFESHEGPEIKTFTLVIDPSRVDPSKIKNWIQLCIMKGLQNLDLSFFHIPFRLGGDILDIPTLKTLKLQNSIIQYPLNLDHALESLNTIVLKKVKFTDTVLQHLVCYCKMLCYLEIVGCHGFQNVFLNAKEHRHFKTVKIGDCSEIQRIAIDAPTLKLFFYCGVVPITRLIGDVLLDEAYVHFVPPRTYFIQPLTMEILVADIFHVTVLTISAPFIEALATRFRGGYFEDATFGLHNLKELQLLMEGGAFCNPFDIAMFLRHCPNLEKLYIDMNGYYFDGGAYWAMHQKPCMNNFSHYFNQLKFVKLLGLKFTGPDIELAKTILKKSPMLEALFVMPPRSGRRPHPKEVDRYYQLFHAWKVSPSARIVFLQNRYDNSGLIPTHKKLWY